MCIIVNLLPLPVLSPPRSLLTPSPPPPLPLPSPPLPPQVVDHYSRTPDGLLCTLQEPIPVASPAVAMVEPPGPKRINEVDLVTTKELGASPLQRVRVCVHVCVHVCMQV